MAVLSTLLCWVTLMAVFSTLFCWAIVMAVLSALVVVLYHDCTFYTFVLSYIHGRLWLHAALCKPSYGTCPPGSQTSQLALLRFCLRYSSESMFSQLCPQGLLVMGQMPSQHVITI